MNRVTVHHPIDARPPTIGDLKPGEMFKYWEGKADNIYMMTDEFQDVGGLRPKIILLRTGQQFPSNVGHSRIIRVTNVSITVADPC